MRNWLWSPSSATQYQWRHRLSDRVFLSLAKRKIERESGKRPRYLALVPRTAHKGLMRLPDGRSYRWFPVLKSGFSSVTHMLISLHGVEKRYTHMVGGPPGEHQPANRVPPREICIWGRTETVQFPRPGAYNLFWPPEFSQHPHADIRFCILRHPLDRFVSFYRNHIIRSELRKRLGLRKQRRRLAPSAPHQRLLSPAAFCAELEKDWHQLPWKQGPDKTPERGGHVWNAHLWPQNYFLGRNANYFTHIFSLSELPRVAEFLSDLHKKHVSMPHINSSNNLPVPHLSASLRRRVEALYKEDFEIFGRHMPPPQV